MTEHFYLKVAFQNKIKKFALSNLNQINFKQIKKGLALTQIWKDSLFSYEILADYKMLNLDQRKTYNQHELIKYLESIKIQNKQTIKLRICQKQTLSQLQNRRKQSQQSLQIPTTIQKKRSKSMDIRDDFDMTCKTEHFEVTSTHVVIQESNKNPSNQLYSSSFNQSIQQRFCKKQNPKVYNQEGKQLQNQRKKGKQAFGQKRQSFNKKYWPKQTKSQQIQIVPDFFDRNSILQSQNLKLYDFCLHQSIKISQKKKSEIEKIQLKIKNRQKQLGLQRQKQKINKFLNLLHI